MLLHGDRVPGVRAPRRCGRRSGRRPKTSCSRPGERATVGTGVSIALPDGYVAFVVPRSGLAAKHGITIVNSPGTVDAGYRGEIRVTLLNTDAREPYADQRGRPDRAAHRHAGRARPLHPGRAAARQRPRRGRIRLDRLRALASPEAGAPRERRPRRRPHARTSSPKSAPADRETDGPLDESEANPVRPYVDLGGVKILPRPDLAAAARGRGGQQARRRGRPRLRGLDAAGAAVRGAAHERALARDPRADRRADRAPGRHDARPSTGRSGPSSAPRSRRPAGRARQPRLARFIGVDGPRWFLRGVISGQARGRPRGRRADRGPVPQHRRRARHHADAAARPDPAARAGDGAGRRRRRRASDARRTTPAPDSSRTTGAGVRGADGRRGPQVGPRPGRRRARPRRRGALLGAMGGVRGLVESILPGLAVPRRLHDHARAAAVGARRRWRSRSSSSSIRLVTPAAGHLGDRGRARHRDLGGPRAAHRPRRGQLPARASSSTCVMVVAMLVSIAGAAAADRRRRRPADRRRPTGARTAAKCRVALRRDRPVGGAVRRCASRCELPLYLAGAAAALGRAKLIMGVPLYAVLLWVTWLLDAHARGRRPRAADGDAERVRYLDVKINRLGCRAAGRLRLALLELRLRRPSGWQKRASDTCERRRPCRQSTVSVEGHPDGRRHRLRGLPDRHGSRATRSSRSASRCCSRTCSAPRTARTSPRRRSRRSARGFPTAEPDTEIQFTPARVVMQDFTGVPCIVDLATMREAVGALGGDADKINPLAPAELVIDHSVIADLFGTENALERNVEIEYERNGERYQFLRWGQTAFDDFKVVPPGTGIVHQVNIEYLARVTYTRDGRRRAARLPRHLRRHRLAHHDGQRPRRARLGRRRHRGRGGHARPARVDAHPARSSASS